MDRIEPTRRLVGGNARLALVEPRRVVVLDLPGFVARAEIGIGDDQRDVAFVGADRLAVLAVSGDQTTLHLVDPDGPTKIGEVVFRGTHRIAAVTGDHVLAVGNDTIVVDTSARELVARPLALRDPVSVASRLDRGRFLLAAGGFVQEWDGVRGAPVRRIRVDRPTDCQFLGGNDRRLWMIGRDEADFVYVVTLSSKTTRRYELPEPAHLVSAHPTGDRLAMVGADTQSVYIVDLTGRKPIKLVDRGPASSVAWVGQEILAIDSRGELGVVEVASDGDGDGDGAADSGAVPIFRTARVEELTFPAVEDASEPALAGAPPPPIAPPSRVVPPSARPVAVVRTPFTDRPTTQRGDDGSARVRTRVHSVEPSQASPGWRPDCARWARVANVGVPRDLPLGLARIDTLCARLGMEAWGRLAVALLYGAYLGGERIAPLALARAIDWRWPEALGNGQLARDGIVRWTRGTIELADEVLAFLDERDALHGVLAEGGGAARSVALVIPGGVDLHEVVAWAAHAAGAGILLAVHPDAPSQGLALELKLHAASPLLRDRQDVTTAAVVVVESLADAEALDLVVVGTYDPDTLPA